MREERDTIKSELTQLKDELVSRDGYIDKVEENRALAATPPPELKLLIERWQGNSKPTRDWTKCNQLLEELNNLI